MTKTNRFTTGTGCYTCRICGRKTRETDPDAAYQHACAQCWELAGLENEELDGLISEQGLKRIDELKAEITKLGGTL